MTLLHPLYRTPLKWIFFDLDNTLWDFDANANEALKVLFHRHELALHTGFQVAQFIQLYQDVNKAYWKKYERGEINKEELRTARFTDTFAQMGLPPAMYPQQVWQEYLDICPQMTLLIPNALQVLHYLQGKVNIGILTNGFEQTQQTKLKTCGFDRYVAYVQTSEAVGMAKPNRAFFETALSRNGIHPTDCLYIGDNQDTDVLGGMNAGIFTYRFCYSDEPTRDEVQRHVLFGGNIHDLHGWIQAL